MDKNKFSHSGDERLRAIETNMKAARSFDELDLDAIADAAWQSYQQKPAAFPIFAISSYVQSFSSPRQAAALLTLAEYTASLLAPRSILQRTAFGVFLVFALVGIIGLAMQIASGPASLLAQQIASAWPLFLALSAIGVTASWYLTSRYRRIPWFDALAVSVCLMAYFSIVGVRVTNGLLRESTKVIARADASEKFGTALASGQHRLALFTSGKEPDKEDGLLYMSAGQGLLEPATANLSALLPRFLRRQDSTPLSVAAMFHEQAHTAALGFPKETPFIEFRFAQFHDSDGKTLRFVSSGGGKTETLQFTAVGLDVSRLEKNACVTLGYHPKTKALLFLQPAAGTDRCAELYEERYKGFQALRTR